MRKDGSRYTCVCTYVCGKGGVCIDIFPWKAESRRSFSFERIGMELMMLMWD